MKYTVRQKFVEIREELIEADSPEEAIDIARQDYDLFPEKADAYIEVYYDARDEGGKLVTE
jgi:hypothetical protein